MTRTRSVTFSRMTSERRCACPCGRPLPPGSRANRRYIDETHKDRAKRARLSAALVAHGLPPKITLETIRSITNTPNSGNPVPKRARKRERKPREGVQVYFPRPEVAQAVLALLEDPATDAERVARDVIDRALTRRLSRA